LHRLTVKQSPLRKKAELAAFAGDKPGNVGASMIDPAER